MTQNPSDRDPTLRSASTLARTAFRWLLLLLWAMWWGGLCFYAIVVIPIGTEVVGTVEQGFITQRVTWWHNAIAGLFLACLTVEAFRKRSRWLFGAAFALLILIATLASWHAHLTGLMNFAEQAVSENFYPAHAVYLWLTALEWGLGLVISIWLFR